MSEQQADVVDPNETVYVKHPDHPAGAPGKVIRRSLDRWLAKGFVETDKQGDALTSTPAPAEPVGESVVEPVDVLPDGQPGETPGETPNPDAAPAAADGTAAASADIQPGETQQTGRAGRAR